ncbi:MAG: hypothetical protein AAB431_00170 [Patescibacteria group bacterium]
MQTYKHTQVGKFVAVLLGMLVVYEFCMMFFLFRTGELNMQSYLAITTSTSLIFVALLALFFSLTVEVNDQVLRLFFGVGLIRKSWRLSEIKSVQVVQNKWWYGLGIHLTPIGWVYNIGGLMAVEIEMKNGKKFRVGSDEAQMLEMELKKHITT